MSRTSSLPRRASVVAIALLALLLAAETAVLAATYKRSGGPVNAVNTATANDKIYLGGPGVEDVTGMATTITVPAQERGLLVITFSASSDCAFDATVVGSSGDCLGRVLVGNTLAQPGTVNFGQAFSSDIADPIFPTLEPHSMQFVAGPLLPGQYLVKVQAWSTDAAVLVMTDRTLTVLRSRVRLERS